MKKLLFLMSIINICTVEIRLFHGAAASLYMKAITHIGITVFRNYPYFEDHTYQEQYYYFDYYAHQSTGIACIAYQDSECIGAILGCSLIDIWDAYKKPFLQHDKDNLRYYFYIGEIVVKQEYQNKGIGNQLYTQLEEKIKKDYHYICLAIVDESLLSMQKSAKRLHTFWESKGFKKTNLFFLDSWKKVGNKEITEHKMIFWIKKLI